MELRVEHLAKAYGENAVLRDLSFSAGEEILGIMAPSGAGKTTLLRIVLGLEQADSGAVTGPERWAAVFQEDRLLEQLSGRDNLVFALGKDFDRPRAGRLLGQLGLDAEDPRPVREYSGGMKRRLALARCLLAESDAIALDEPFTGLDDGSRAKAIAAIRTYGAGKPVLLVTHDRRDIEAAGARLLLLKG